MFQVTALADCPPDVVARQVPHTERPHRKAKLLDRFVHLLRGAALIEQEAGLAAVLLDHAVANEAIAHARDHGGLLDLLGDGHDGGQDVLTGLGATHYLEQPHDVGRTEEMQTDHVLRAFGKGRDLVHVQRGRVGRKDGTGLHHSVERLEHLLLDTHFLEHRFNHQIGVAKGLVVQGGRQQCHALLVLVLLELALLDLGLVVFADRGHAAVQCFLLHLQHRDRDTGIEEVHRDATAHGACTDHGDLGHGALGRIRGHIGNLGGCTFGHEQMAQRAALRRVHQVDEALTLVKQGLLERLFCRVLDGVHTLARSWQVLGHALHHVACKLEIRIALRVLAWQVTHPG